MTGAEKFISIKSENALSILESENLEDDSLVGPAELELEEPGLLSGGSVADRRWFLAAGGGSIIPVLGRGNFESLAIIFVGGRIPLFVAACDVAFAGSAATKASNFANDVSNVNCDVGRVDPGGRSVNMSKTVALFFVVSGVFTPPACFFLRSGIAGGTSRSLLDIESALLKSRDGR